VSTLDISATILQLAGAPMPDVLMGAPLFGNDGKPVAVNASGKPVQRRDYVYLARDNWDEVVDCMRAVYTTRYAYIRNYLPQYPYDRHQIYLDFHRPAIHVMRTLHAQQLLPADAAPFMAPSKPAEELYDMQRDPNQLHNLAADPLFADTLQSMRNRMDAWQSAHRDLGLEDLNRRNPSKERFSLRDWVKMHHPDAWQKLLQGEIGDQYEQWQREKKNTRSKKHPF
jgi:arylsulfatase A-like enzyme